MDIRDRIGLHGSAAIGPSEELANPELQRGRQCHRDDSGLTARPGAARLQHVAPRRSGLLNPAAGRPATNAGAPIIHAIALDVETEAVPPSPQPSRIDPAATSLAQQHAALYRLHLDALACLPELSRLEADANAAVARAVEAAVCDLPPQDGRRLELVRAASCFLNPAGPGSFERAKEALSRIAIGGLEGDTASSEQLDQAWGSSTERRAALMDTLPHWLVRVNGDSVGPLCERLSSRFQDAHPSLAERASELVLARTRQGRWLPEGTDWLGSEGKRDRVLRNGQSAAMTQAGNRLQFAELTALAADLPALKGHRHRLVKFVRERLRREGLFREDRPVVVSSDVRALLQALLRQLAHPDFDSGLTQNEILALAAEQFASEAMHPDDRRQVLATLLPLIGSLNASRFSGSQDVQGEAIQTVAQGINHLPAQSCAPLLRRILDLSVDWSTDRRSAAGKYVPHTRSEVKEFTENQIVGNLITMGSLGLKAGTKWLVGRRGVQEEAAEIVGTRLERLMTFDAPATTARALLPLCRHILQADGAMPGDRRKLRNRALASLALGGLPVGESPGERGRSIEQGLGSDPALRTEVAQWLTKACLGKHSRADSISPVAAARYLHHLLELGGHTLNAREVEAARRAVLNTVRTAAAEPTATAVMSAMLAEIEADRVVQARDGSCNPEHEALATALARGAMRGFHMIDPREAAKLMPHIVSAYGGMPGADRAEVDARLMRHLGGPVAVDSVATRPQLAGLGLIRSLSRYRGNDPAQLLRLADEVWPRLNRSHQQAALKQLFDEVDAASPVGLTASIAFAARRRDDGDFVDAAVPMMRQLLDGAGPRDSLHAGVRDLAEQVVCERLPVMAPSHASELVANAVDGAAELPATLWLRFISHAPRLDAVSLRQLLTAWCNSLPARAPREPEQLRHAWERVLHRLEPQAADVVNAFMHVAAESAPALQLPRPTRPVGHAAACELAAALPRMDVASMQVALRHIHRAELPGALRNEVTRNVLAQYPRIQVDLRPAALDMCFSWDPVRTLHMLADRVGRREIQSGKLVWSSLEQSIPLAASGQTLLRRELLQRPAGDVLPALEVLAERHAAAMPKVHREAIADVLATRLPDLSSLQRRRVMDTFVLAHPDLEDAHILGLGVDPADPAWAEARKTPPEQIQQKLQSLRESRWPQSRSSAR